MFNFHMRIYLQVFVSLLCDLGWKITSDKNKNKKKMSRLESRASHSLALRIPGEICECLCIWCIHYIPWHRRCKSVWQCNCMIFHFLWSLLISVCLSLYHSLTRSVSIAFGVCFGFISWCLPCACIYRIELTLGVRQTCALWVMPVLLPHTTWRH